MYDYYTITDVKSQLPRYNSSVFINTNVTIARCATAACPQNDRKIIKAE